MKTSTIWLLIGIAFVIFVVWLGGSQDRPTVSTQSVAACTNFEYSGWSGCATDSTQSRAITKAYPEGCSGGNPIQFQGCNFEPLPKGVTAQKIWQQMITQIKSAPDQTISASYISGADAGSTTNLVWRVKNDGLYLYAKVYRTANKEDQSAMEMVDSNFDAQPDWISDRGQQFVAISSTDQHYKEIILSWATLNAYFASNLLEQ